MATTTEVNPGDLITAELMNNILQRLLALEDKVGAGTSGTVIVPSVFGFTLASARSLLIAPTQQLALGVVVGIDGAVVDPTLPGNASRMVLVQMPPAGRRVPPGSSVDLIVVASGGATSQPQAPAITLILPSTAPVGADVEIEGSGFASLFSSNTVLFDGIAGTVLPGNNVARLNVVVPTGIPGAPTAPGGPTKNSVQVVVQVGGLSSQPFPLNVSAPTPNKPTITSLTPSAGSVGKTLSINGTNFGAAIENNRVKFDNATANITAASSTTLAVTVPAGVVSTAPKFDVQLVVTNLSTGLDSLPFTCVIAP